MSEQPTPETDCELKKLKLAADSENVDAYLGVCTERDELRSLLVSVINNGTDGIALIESKASLDFLRHVPSECASVKRQRDEAREQNAYLRCIAERAIDYLDQSYRDGFSDEASDLRYELKQLKEGGK